MLVQRNMKHVYWYLRNLQLMLKSLGAFRNHISPHYDTMKCAVTGRQVATLAVDKFHFKGTLDSKEKLAKYREELARAKYGMVGARLDEEGIDDLRDRFPDEEFDRYVTMRRVNEGCEALAIIAHSDIFKRPPWFIFASSLDHMDRFTWSLPPDYE